MEEILRQLLEKVTQLSEGQAQIVKRLDNIENTIVTKELFEKTMSGSQKDIIAMLERTATKEDVARLETSIEVLNTKIFRQEVDIAALKIVK